MKNSNKILKLWKSRKGLRMEQICFDFQKGMKEFVPLWRNEKTEV